MLRNILLALVGSFTLSYSLVLIWNADHLVLAGMLWFVGYLLIAISKAWRKIIRIIAAIPMLIVMRAELSLIVIIAFFVTGIQISQACAIVAGIVVLFMLGVASFVDTDMWPTKAEGEAFGRFQESMRRR